MRGQCHGDGWARLQVQVTPRRGRQLLGKQLSQPQRSHTSEAVEYLLATAEVLQ